MNNYFLIRYDATYKGDKMCKLYNIELVIFDMDGLLFDTERMTYRATKRIMNKKGYHYNLNKYIATMGYTKTDADTLKRKMFGKDLINSSLFQEINAEFQKELKTKGLVIKNGAVRLLEFLKEKKIVACVASSSNRKTIKRNLKRANLERFFSFYIGGDEIKKGKPAPDIFLKACDKNNTSVTNAIVLEDSTNGLMASKSANIKCIMVPDLIKSNKEMIKNSFAIVKDLNEVIKIIS